eukprot:scaffold21446_cov22-Tisochrysis_lutea.AAC.5
MALGARVCRAAPLRSPLVPILVPSKAISAMSKLVYKGIMQNLHWCRRQQEPGRLANRLRLKESLRDPGQA